MKTKIYFFSALFAAVLLLHGCEKEVDEFGYYSNGQKFYLNIAGIQGDESDNTKLSINNQWNKILFDENDIININNIDFRIYLDQYNRWCAERSDHGDSLYGETFSAYYMGSNVSKSGTLFTFAKEISGAPNNPNPTTDPSTGEPIQYALTYYNSSVFMAGITHDSLVTIRPACALIHFSSRAITSNVRVAVGFSVSDAIPRIGSVSPSDNSYPTITGTTFFEKVEPINGWGCKIIVGGMLVATNEYSESGDYYVPVPMPSASGITTDLFIEVKSSINNNSYYFYKKIQGVHLTPGSVYTITFS